MSMQVGVGAPAERGNACRYCGRYFVSREPAEFCSYICEHKQGIADAIKKRRQEEYMRLHPHDHPRRVGRVEEKEK